MAFPRQDAYRKKPTGTQRMAIALRIFRKKGSNKMYALKCDRCKKDICLSAKVDEVRYGGSKHVYNIEGVEYVLCDACDKLYGARVRNFFLGFLNEEVGKGETM